jgi:hypothetical protein
MDDEAELAKAELRELDADFKNEINREKWTVVQFNPETLKVAFANQIATPSGAGDQSGTPARQFVGAGTTKLTVQLWFDASAPLPVGALPDGSASTDDVRKLTQRVAYFITPILNKATPPQFVPPAVRFLWGSFQFDGILESLEESLEFFSRQGRPLRASMTLNISQQKITEFAFRDAGLGLGIGGSAATPGTHPLTQAPAGATMQGLAGSQGRGAEWKTIAAANNIENPRLLTPGQLIDFNIRKS